MANLVSDSVTPRLIPEIEILTREGAKSVYVRVGSTNRRADGELIDELRRFARGEGPSAGGLPVHSNQR